MSTDLRPLACIARSARSALCGVVAIVSLLGCGGPALSPPLPTPDRVVLITIDTLRADHVGTYGYPRDTSPFLDSLGERGVVFERAYASTSHTAPSHASLFTALELPQHRLLQNGESLHEDLVTLAELYRDAGYQTAGFSTAGFTKGLSAGFDTFEAKGRYHPAETILGLARDWLATRDATDKLFLWIHLFDVHEWHREDRLHDSGLRWLEEQALRGDALAEYHATHHGTRFGRLGRDEVLGAIDRYDGQLWATDRALESFYADVQGRFPAGHTVWVVTSDHGEGLGGHDFLGHGRFLYEEQLRVPLIVHWAGTAEDGAQGKVPEPRRVPQSVGLVDLGATLASWAGADFSAQPLPVVGRSLDPLFRGDAWETRPLYAQRRPIDDFRRQQSWEEGEVFSTLDGRYKLIAQTSGAHEFYDLAVDPFEATNLFDDPNPELQAVRSELLRRLVRQYREMMESSEGLVGAGIDERHVEELRALGYL